MSKDVPMSATFSSGSSDDRIREQAYLSWEADGSPAGRDLEYWEIARKTIDSSDGAALVNSVLHGQTTYEGGFSAQPPLPVLPVAGR
jgi:hypothetical protein